MHLLISYINQVLLITPLFVLITFAVNHISMSGGVVACVDTEGRHFERCL